MFCCSNDVVASQYARVEISRKEESAHGPGARCGFAGHAAPEPRNQGAPQSHRPVLERHCAPGLHDVGRQHAHRAVSARTPRFGCVPIRHRTGVLHHSLHRVASARTHGKEGSDHAFRRRLGCARAQDRAHAHRVRPCCGDHARRAPVGDDAVHWIHPGRAGTVHGRPCPHACQFGGDRACRLRAHGG